MATRPLSPEVKDKVKAGLDRMILIIERLQQQLSSFTIPPIETSPPALLQAPKPSALLLSAPPSAPLPAPPAPQLPPQPISAPVPAQSHPPSPSVKTIEKVEHKQVYKPLRNIRKQPIKQKHRASKTVPRIRVSKSFKKCIGWPTKSSRINMRFSRDKEPDTWYTTILNSTQKLASEAIPNQT